MKQLERLPFEKLSAIIINFLNAVDPEGEDLPVDYFSHADVEYDSLYSSYDSERLMCIKFNSTDDPPTDVYLVCEGEVLEPWECIEFMCATFDGGTYIIKGAK